LEKVSRAGQDPLSVVVLIIIIRRRRIREGQDPQRVVVSIIIIIRFTNIVLETSDCPESDFICINNSQFLMVAM
jgi:hypothetical protein